MLVLDRFVKISLFIYLTHILLEDLWIDVDGRLLVLPPGTPEVDTKGERQFWPASILPKGDRPLLVNTDGETMVMVKDLDESDRILSDATKSFASEDKNGKI